MPDNEVKFARPDDIAQIVAMGYQEFEEGGLKAYGQVDFEKTLEIISDLVFKHVVLVKRNNENNKLVDGFIAFRIGPAWFSSDPLMLGMMFFVKQEHRTFKTAKNLLSAAKEYAIINRLPLVFDLFAQKDVEKKKKLFRYLGFKDFGSSFVFIPEE